MERDLTLVSPTESNPRRLHKEKKKKRPSPEERRHQERQELFDAKRGILCEQPRPLARESSTTEESSISTSFPTEEMAEQGTPQASTSSLPPPPRPIQNIQNSFYTLSAADMNRLLAGYNHQPLLEVAKISSLQNKPPSLGSQNNSNIYSEKPRYASQSRIKSTTHSRRKHSISSCSSKVKTLSSGKNNICNNKKIKPSAKETIGTLSKPY